MTIFDLIVIGILLLSTGLAVIRGAILELATLLAVAIAFLIATQLSGPVASLFGGRESLVALTAGYVIVTGVIFVFLYILAHFLLNRYRLNPQGDLVNRIAGGVFGFVRGYILVGLGFLAYGYYLSEENQHDSVRNAFTRPIAASGAGFFERFIPERNRFGPDGRPVDADTGQEDAAAAGYGQSDRAGLAEVITTVTTDEDTAAPGVVESGQQDERP